MRWLPPLNALRSFEAVGRLHNVKDAAIELNVTTAAVNHQIRVLEQHLGTDLFARTKAGLVPTPEGKQFLTFVSQAFEQIMRGYRQIGTHDGARRLVVEGPAGFMNGFVIPRIHKFQLLYPDLLLELNALVNPIGELNFAETSADISIRAGSERSQWPGLQAEKLFHQEMTPVCAPSFLNGPNALKTPEDLANHMLLITTAAAEGWEEWIAAAEAHGMDMSGVNPRRGIRFSQLNMSIVAAVNGVGIDLGRTPFVNAPLQRGQLVAPFYEIRVTTRMAYWAVSPKSAAENKQAQDFREWLKSEVETSRQFPPLEKVQARSPNLKLV
jgi:LysR family glycine cleavage system transcriptional activator